MSKREGHPDRSPSLTKAEMRRLLYEAKRVKSKDADMMRVYLDKREGKLGIRTYKEK